MTYNLLNLPATSIKNAGTDNEVTTEWSYLADGTKIAAYVSPCVDVAVDTVAVESIRPAPRGRVLGLREGEGEPVADSTEVVGGRVGYLYTGSFRINWDDSSGPQLESVASVGGRFVMAIDPSNSSFTAQQRYFITDHLGSTRVVLNNAGSVLERYDYYPYGEKIDVSVASSGNTDYLYTGKESQNALFGINWYDSAARFQTTDGIFTSIDPLAEKYYHISPYAYCAGNPVNVVDPTGLDGIMTGSGTEEDPYVITANYYYQTGSLDSETVDGLNRALADYNNKGRSRKITMSDGSKVFVRFQLSAKEVDNLEESYLNDWTLDANGGQIRYGNKVDTSANPSNSEGNEFGSANRETVSINLSNIDNGVKNGFNKSQLIEGTFLHEIGHNLGLDHTDNSTIMDKPMKHIQNQNGQTNKYETYPVIDKAGIGIMIMRDNTNRIKRDAILGAINKK